MLQRPNVSNRSPEGIVRRSFRGLTKGHVVDALDVFATDAVVRDERGKEHRGIREIAAAFARRREPVRLEVVVLWREEDLVTALVEDRRGPEGAPIAVYQGLFRVDRGRVRSLTMRPVPPPRGPE